MLCWCCWWAQAKLITILFSSLNSLLFLQTSRRPNYVANYGKLRAVLRLTSTCCPHSYAVFSAVSRLRGISWRSKDLIQHFFQNRLVSSLSGASDRILYAAALEHHNDPDDPYCTGMPCIFYAAFLKGSNIKTYCRLSHKTPEDGTDFSWIPILKSM